MRYRDYSEAIRTDPAKFAAILQEHGTLANQNPGDNLATTDPTELAMDLLRGLVTLT